MQPCSKEMMQGLNANPQLISLQDLQQHNNTSTNTTSSASFDPSSSDDFIEQMLSSIPSSWPTAAASGSIDLKSPNWLDESIPHHAAPFDESSLLASKLRLHQISNSNSAGAGISEAAAKLMLQQQLLMAAVADASFTSSALQGGEGLFNGFGGGDSMQHGGVGQHFHHPQGGGLMQAQNHLGGGGGGSAQQQQPPMPAASGSSGSGPPGQPKQRVRARRGQATDPHSIAERLRRERIAERMKALQELVPNANKTDKASMLDEIIDYVKFLQLQVKVLSMSRLGGAAAVAPLVAEGGGDCAQTGANGGSHTRGNQTPSTDDNLTMTEHQVAKLMEEDMGQAMQYLQGKGLCLMPISLATAISTATCRNRITNSNNHNHPSLQSNGVDGPSSPSMSVLTVQSATIGNSGGSGQDGPSKDAVSASKP